MTKQEISKARRELDKARREFSTKVMEDYNKTYRANIKALYDMCQKDGHSWRFVDLTSLNVPYYVCNYCGISHIDVDGEIKC